MAGAVIDVIEHDFVARACGWPLSRRGEAAPVTDAAGRASLRELPALAYGSRHYVVAVHADYAEGILDQAQALPRVAGVASARIALTRGAGLAGRLAERPVEGDALKVRAVWDDPSVPGCYGVVRSAAVRADGTFQLDGLHPGAHSLLLLRADAILARVRAEVPSAEPVVLAQTRTRDVTGVVLDEHGAPVPRAEIQLRGPASFRDTTTDAEGRFVLRDVPISQTLTLEAVRLETGTVAREMLSRHSLEAGEGDVELRCDARERTPVDFVVRGSDGGEITLSLRDAAGSFAFFGSFLGREISGRLWVPPGRYEVLAEAGCEEANELRATHYACAVVDSSSARTARLECDLVPTFSVAFELIDEVTAEPIVGARLAGDPRELWSMFYMENSDGAGRVWLHALGAIGLRVDVRAPGYERLTQEVELRAAQPPIELRMRRTPGMSH
ncbi:MAG: carboxypeptidase regulatory-like domain-containing protein [Polyangiaceae bacterium]|nr:carboxypeptidase regulatory-like domain-containing protein [Polyangiaceae bacterium]